MEISSLLSGIYIDSPVEESDEEAQPSVNPAGSVEGRSTDVSSLSQSVQALHAEINALKDNLRTSNESALNREAVCRDTMNLRFEDLIETFMQRSLAKLERGVTECLQRRYEQWRKELARITKISTPMTRYSVGAVSSDSERMYTSVPTASYAKPPIHFEFPRFGETRETSVAMEFERCEKIFDAM